MEQPAEPWYHGGLAFSCTRCGACCTGAPGFVWVTEDELRALADHCGEPLDGFTRRFVRRIGHRLSLIEKPNGDCIFYDCVSGCTVYAARPRQCRAWPFWPKNLASPADWAETCRVCPGAGQGTVFPLEQIEAVARELR